MPPTSVQFDVSGWMQSVANFSRLHPVWERVTTGIDIAFSHVLTLRCNCERLSPFRARDRPGGAALESTISSLIAAAQPGDHSAAPTLLHVMYLDMAARHGPRCLTVRDS